MTHVKRYGYKDDLMRRERLLKLVQRRDGLIDVAATWEGINDRYVSQLHSKIRNIDQQIIYMGMDGDSE